MQSKLYWAFNSSYINTSTPIFSEYVYFALCVFVGRLGQAVVRHDYANKIYEFLFEIICLHYIPCPAFLIHTSTYQSTNIDICNPSKLYDAYICLRKLCYQCLAQWCLININWTLQNKFQWNWNKTITSSFKKNLEKISQHLISASVG